MKSWIGLLFSFMVLTMFSSPALAATYYVDPSATGCGGSGCSDSNNGTSKATAWLHAPEMTNCTSTCSSATVSAGSSIIFRGGTVEGPGSFNTWIWTHSGSSGAGSDYIGVDKTWFVPITGTVNTSGSSVTWVSGVHAGFGTNIIVGDFGDFLDGQTLTINGTDYTVSSCSSSTTCTLGTSAGTQTGVSFSFNVWTRPIMSGGAPSGVMKFLELSSGTSYVTIDNLEWTGMYSTLSAPSSGQIDYIDISRNINDHIHIENCYFHGGNVAHDSAHNAHFLLTNTGSGDSSNEVDHNVFDNSDFCNATNPPTIGGATCTLCGVEGSIYSFHDNFIGYFSNGWVTDWSTLIYENTIEVIVLSPDNGTDHENGIENNGGTGVIMFNNVIQHFVNNGIVDFQLAPVSSPSYEFNNVLPDMDGGNMQQCYEGTPANNECVMFNNTAEAGPDSGNPSGTCGRNTGSNTTTQLTNEHCISSKNGTTWWQGTATFTTDIVQSKTTANSQGYTLGSTYSFQPTSGSGATVGAGTNMTSTCTTINGLSTIAGAACLQDTTYGVAYDVSSHTITGAGRTTTNTRPSSGAWDIGAYQFNAGSPIPTSPAENMFVMEKP